jgi:aspartyl-tRNA(Asn)/glutamyl-tRNA(Gln) amidotransferase subunit A
MSADGINPASAGGPAPTPDAAAAIDVTIAELSRAIAARTVTSLSITEQCLARIRERDTTINAFIAVLADQARAQAEAADREIASGRYRGPLHGVPVSLKDLIDVEGTPTTAASRVRAGHTAARDAAVVTRLRAAGAVIIGKTNLHEFAFGTTNEDSAYGPAHHPLDPSRSPGGSSGGSAASVLAGMAFASIGTDTGGSIRIPAAACGLVGLKPGFGEVPTDGVFPLSATLDHTGPICRSVQDTAILHRVLTESPEKTARSRPASLEGMRFGVLRSYFTTALDAEVAAAFESACARLSDAGAVLEDVSIAHAGDIAPVYLHIVLSEAAAYHAKTLESRADDYTPNVRVRLEMGRYILAEDYVRALRGRDVLREEVDAALEGRAALLLPSLPIPAPKLGATTVRLAGTDEPVRNVMLRLTQLFNISGHPAISLPLSSRAQGLPTSLQLVGTRGQTGELIDVASAVEPQVGPGTSG